LPSEGKSPIKGGNVGGKVEGRFLKGSEVVIAGKKVLMLSFRGERTTDPGKKLADGEICETIIRSLGGGEMNRGRRAQNGTQG